MISTPSRPFCVIPFLRINTTSSLSSCKLHSHSDLTWYGLNLLFPYLRFMSVYRPRGRCGDVGRLHTSRPSGWTSDYPLEGGRDVPTSPLSVYLQGGEGQRVLGSGPLRWSPSEKECTNVCRRSLEHKEKETRKFRTGQWSPLREEKKQDKVSVLFPFLKNQYQLYAL